MSSIRSPALTKLAITAVEIPVPVMTGRPNATLGSTVTGVAGAVGGAGGCERGAGGAGLAAGGGGADFGGAAGGSGTTLVTDW